MTVTYASRKAGPLRLIEEVRVIELKIAKGVFLPSADEEMDALPDYHNWKACLE